MAYKPRMDFVRGVIIETHGTPYQDVLVVFDLFLTESYPSSPPLVRYESCGLSGIIPRIDNLDDFKLVVSNGSGGWDIPWVSSMNVLQILVFTRDLILNTNYYDEFINESYRKFVSREWSAILCSKNIIIKSLKTLA
uniref:probable ubiquitin-conjugating enzyme E2 25 n=1 Tax=Erigeron canadensis TaxID=72917 RepID=UPI001CB8B661|nr:probable ubiquitin-conjugating enzyme E2 25 [Erigeron canadensis]